ncbi:MAG: hypothetical protein V4736_05305 [Bdellovibrionota bacterium]
MFTKNRAYIFGIIFLATTFFQNCAPSFRAIDDKGLRDLSSVSGTPTPAPSPMPSPAPAPVPVPMPMPVPAAEDKFESYKFQKIWALNDNNCGRDFNNKLFCWGMTFGAVPVEIPNLIGVKDVIRLSYNKICAVKSDGLTACWTNKVFTYTEVAGLGPVKALRASPSQSYQCAISTDEKVKCWGTNYLGTLGSASTDQTTAIVTVQDLEGVKDLSVGVGMVCALLGDASVKCWGNEFPTNSLVPKTVAGLNNVRSLAVGSTYYTNASYACAVLTDNRVKCWGASNRNNLLSLPTTELPVELPEVVDIQSLVTKQGYVCVVSILGNVRCWGRNPNSMFTPVDELNYSVGPTFVGAKEVVLGNSHTCFLMKNDSVRCTGSNARNQLGQTRTINNNIPIEVPGLSNAKSIVAGSYFSCGISEAGKVICVGSGSRNSLVYEVPGITDALSVSIKGTAGCAVTKLGSVRCWGSYGYFLLGKPFVAESIEVPNVTNAISVFAHDQHACALLADGVIKCWGYILPSVPSTTIPGAYTVGASQPIHVASIPGAKQIAHAAWNTTYSAATGCTLSDGGVVKCFDLVTKKEIPTIRLKQLNPANGTVGLTLDDKIINFNTNGFAAEVITGITSPESISNDCALTKNSEVKCWDPKKVITDLFGTLRILDFSSSAPPSSLTNSLRSVLYRTSENKVYFNGTIGNFDILADEIAYLKP